MDMQFAAKEMSRVASKQEEQYWRTAKGLARYLKDSRIVVIEYRFRKLPEKVVAWSDTHLFGASERGDQPREVLSCSEATASRRTAENKRR